MSKWHSKLKSKCPKTFCWRQVTFPSLSLITS